MSKVDDRITRLRIYGPVYLDTANNWLQSLCFWCRRPVQMQAFLPAVQPTDPGDDSISAQIDGKV